MAVGRFYAQSLLQLIAYVLALPLHKPAAHICSVSFVLYANP
eukprot:COSAG01_NODE_31013_length_605_cov_1.128458_1_plen_41_part_10